MPAPKPARAWRYASLAARIWMQDSRAWAEWQPWWDCERRLHASQAAGRGGHTPDAEVHWPSLDGCPYDGQVWAIEAELTPKGAARTARIMSGLLIPVRYARSSRPCGCPSTNRASAPA